MTPRESLREALARHMSWLLARMNGRQLGDLQAFYGSIRASLAVDGEIGEVTAPEWWRQRILAVFDDDPRVHALERENADLRGGNRMLEDRLFNGVVSYCLKRDLEEAQRVIALTGQVPGSQPQRIRCTDTGELFELGDTGSWYQIPASELQAMAKELAEANGKLERIRIEVARLRGGELEGLERKVADGVAVIRQQELELESLRASNARLAKELEDAREHIEHLETEARTKWPTCPDCSCRLGTDDPDRLECGCAGPCGTECKENGYPQAPSYRDIAVGKAVAAAINEIRNIRA